MDSCRIAFAGDRDIAVWVLDYLLRQNVQPLALLVPSPAKASHATDLMARCAYLSSDYIMQGAEFRLPAAQQRLSDLNLDFIIGIHFPYLVPESVLAIPRHGVLNLHPAYLPYNRGWHTPSWAILDGTPVGATLHFMDADIDTGDIVHRKLATVAPDDTADKLYQKLKQLELETFIEAWPALADGSFARVSQHEEVGTVHRRIDLFTESVQRLDLDSVVNTGQFLRRLRALTTNRLDEAAYFEVDGQRYRVQIAIHPERPAGNVMEQHT